MIAFISWFLTISLAGWLVFPIAYRLLPALPDRGFALSRALGWLLWGYLFWLLGSLGILQNDLGGVLLAIILVAALSAWAIWGRRFEEIKTWIREHARYILATEIIFLVAFALWTFVRAANPIIDNTEKPMEMAFLNAILRSPTLPPHDPWLSGYAISYYYFGYILVTLIIRVTGVTTGVGFNLAIALLFGLTAAGAYGLLYNLLALRKVHEESAYRTVPLRLPIIGPLFILLVSNLEGFLEVLHARGIFWNTAVSGGTSSFWSWLGIQEINLPPVSPLSWVPTRSWAWWRASRVLGDFLYNGIPREVIDEFPFFSYLLADLHPHVLAMPFAFLMMGLALNVYLERARNGFTVLGLEIPFSRPGFLLAVVLLGGLAFLNTWDFPVYIALVCGAYVLTRVQQLGWRWARLGEFIGLGALLGIAGALLYLPFYIGFSSQAGGILPSVVMFTRGTQFWVMFAPLLLPILGLLVYRVAKSEPGTTALGKGMGLSLIAVLGLWVGMYVLAYAISLLPGLGGLFMEGVLGAAGTSIGTVIRASLFGHTSPDAGWLPGRLTAPGAWISLTALLGLILALLIGMGKMPAGEDPEGDQRVSLSTAPKIEGFWVLLVLMATLLVLAPEFFFLRDQFSYRMNTIFKFYYQAWMLWGIGAAFAAVVLAQELRAGWGWIYRAGLAVVLVMALAYPVWSLWMKTDGFQPAGGLTLDGNAYLADVAPDDVAAVEWLRQAPPGVIAEAVGQAYRSETSRLATLSGDPTVLGWTNHESQWRGGGHEMGSREADLRQLYESGDWNTTLRIIQAYSIRYIEVGSIERNQYHVNEGKFLRNLHQAFKSGSVTIYEVPESMPAVTLNGQG